MENMDQEKDGLLDEPKTWQSSTTKMTSVNFDAKLWELSKQERIAIKDALEFGIRFLSADKIGVGYPDCNLQEKLFKIVAHRNSLLKEVGALREQVQTADDVEDKEDVDDIFKAKVNEVKQDG